MQKINKILCAFCLVLTLAGCGMEVVTPEGNPENSESETGTGNEALTERTCEIAEYDRCVSQFQLAQQDLQSCLMATQKLEKNLKAYQAKVTENQATTERLNNIFKNYTETTDQKEFKFDLCGKISNFEEKTWFDEFKITLETNPIPFTKAGRNLNTDDFTGGCASSEGNMAFFMGAETDGFSDSAGSGSDLFEPDDLFEFHLLKYDIATKMIQETLIPEGLCDDETCPAIFHSREGAMIPMSGISQTQECSYKYYFDQNILVQESCTDR